MPSAALPLLISVLPCSNGCLTRVWFQGKEMSSRKSHLTLDAPLDHIPLHVRGGHIIPTQEPAINTALRYFTSTSALTSNQTLTTSSKGQKCRLMTLGPWFIFWPIWWRGLFLQILRATFTRIVGKSIKIISIYPFHLGTLSEKDYVFK